MATLSGFDASKVEPSGDFTPIPAGKYLAFMFESAFKPTKSGDGEFLECKFRICDGEQKGRTLISRLNLKNRNDQACQIAASELSSICRAVGVLKPADSADLHNVPLEITVAVTAQNEKGQVYNEIKKYEKRGTMETESIPSPSGKPAWMGK
jgi:hypothetical protein